VSSPIVLTKLCLLSIDRCRECMQETSPPLKPIPHQSSALNVGMPPCSPIRSPGVQPSPVPVYSPSYAPSPTSPYEDIITVPAIHAPMSAASVNREAAIQSNISLGDSYSSYCGSPSVDNKDKDIMQIMQNLMSPVGSPSSEPAPLPTYPDVIYCGTPASPESQAPGQETSSHPHMPHKLLPRSTHMYIIT